MKNYYLLFSLFLALQTAQAQVPGAKWVVAPLDSADAIDISVSSTDPRFVAKKGKLYGLYERSGKQLLPYAYASLRIYPGAWVVGQTATTPQKPSVRVLLNKKYQDMGRAYDKFEAHNGGLAVVYKDKLCGLINMQGEELVPLSYETVRQYGNELVFVQGDQQKKYPVPPLEEHPRIVQKKLEDAKKILPGYTLVKVNGLSGFLNSKGDTVVPALYTRGPIHPKDYLVASLDGGKTWGVIDAKHNTLFPFTATNKPENWTKSGLLPLKNDNQWGVVQFPSGTVKIPFGDYDRIETYDAEKDLFLVSKDKLVGIVDAANKVIIPVAYSYVNGADQVTAGIGKSRLHGYWHRPTQHFHDPEFLSVQNLNDSLVIVEKADTTWGVIDVKTGKTVVPFSKFGIKKAGPYFMTDYKYDSTMSSTASGRLHGLYDRKGKLVFAPDTVDLHIYPDGSYFIYSHYKKTATDYNEHRSAKGETLRKLSKIGCFVRKPNWIASSQNPNGKYEYSMFLYSDPPGQEQYFQKLENEKEKVCVFIRDKKYGLMDPNGKILLPAVFDKMEDSKEGYIHAKYEGKWGVLQNPLFDYFDQ